MTIPVNKFNFYAGSNAFPVAVTIGGLQATLGELLSELNVDKVAIVMDTGCELVAATTVQDAVAQAGASSVVVSINPSEADKSLGQVERVYDAFFSQLNGSRQSVVLAVGGGIVANIAGVAASTIFRGVRLIHIPTTLLNAHDVATSSLKQAINFRGRKNVIGSYHAPSGVIVDVTFFRTLDQREVRSAVGELVKNALVFGGDDWNTALKAIDLTNTWPSSNPSSLVDLVMAGIAAKQRLLREDAYERNGALAFEFGHTVGHALELVAQVATHGECVAIGCVVACRISSAMGIMGGESLQECEELVAALNPRIRLPADSRENIASEILMRVRADNKRGYDPDATSASEMAPMVLLKSVGNMCEGASRPLLPVKLGLIEAEINKLLREDQWFI